MDKKIVIENTIKLINKNCSIDKIIHNIKISNISFNEFLIAINEQKDVFHNLLEILNININMFTAIYNEIILINLNKKYKRKYCIEYVLILILQLKNNVNNWKNITKIKYI